MFQKEDYYKREAKFHMDCFLGLDENSQEDLQVIPKDMFEGDGQPCSDEKYFSPCIRQGGNC